MSSTHDLKAFRVTAPQFITCAVAFLLLMITVFLYFEWRANSYLRLAAVSNDVSAAFNAPFTTANNVTQGLVSSLVTFNSTENEKISKLFEYSMMQSPNIYQIRWLTISGDEQAKMVRDSSSKLVQLEPEQLQNKSHRDYFQKALSSSEFNVFSSLELNKEFNQIELPWRPVFRVMRQFTFADGTQAVLIINVEVSDYLEISKQANSGIEVFVIDSNGIVLFHQNDKLRFGHQLEEGYFFAKERPFLFTSIRKFSNFTQNYTFWSVSKTDTLKKDGETYQLYSIAHSPEGSILQAGSIAFVLLALSISIVFFLTHRHERQIRQIQKQKALQEAAEKREKKILHKHSATLQKLEQAAHIGTWEYDLKHDKLAWSLQTKILHDLPADYEPQIDTAIEFYKEGESRDRIAHVVQNAMETGEPWVEELELVTAKGRNIWVIAHGQAEFENGVCVKLFGMFQDVTESQQIKRDALEQKELLSITLRSIGDGVITTDDRACITWMNPIAEQLTGWSLKEAKGAILDTVFKTIDENTGAQIENNPVDLCLNGNNIIGFNSSTVLLSKSGEKFGITESAAPICNEEGQVYGAVLVFHDVTEQRRMSGEMEYRAAHDSLTGLKNRAEFEVKLAQSHQSCFKDGISSVLLYVDLDQFKIINDTCGHSVGDELLQQIARLLESLVRHSDTVARLGGDEFGVILNDCSVEKGKKIAQSICDRLENFRFTHNKQIFKVGSSIGLVAINSSWSNLPEIMQAADKACYAAKDDGRNRVCVYEDSDLSIKRRQDEIQWVTRLEQAFSEDKFVLFAQKIAPVNKSDECLQFEVLLRLQEGENLISPGLFMPAVERFNMATKVDMLVVTKVIDNLIGNMAELENVCMVHVNISGQSIGNRFFHEELMQILQNTPKKILSRLCLEITETSAITSIADAAAFIEQVKSLGVEIALDDFGSGAATFSYLKNIPIDILKIDGSFIKGLLDDSLDDVAVRSFVQVANVMKIKTIAEFVENEEILKRLKALGVDYAQGYHIHKPEPLDNVLTTSLNKTAV